MENLEMPKNTHRQRGEQRFAAITYSKVAEWSGYTLSTIQGYGAKGKFPKEDVIGTILWVNEQRQKRGWSLLGVPETECDNVPPSVVMPSVSGYDPLRADFR
tara:strand:+ start:691 stop:996 length:306 start_codon:yes stop_codon:yes gene_type:complete